MNIEITIVKTFCDFGLNFFKQQPLWPFFIKILAINCEKNLATLPLSDFGHCLKTTLIHWLRRSFSLESWGLSHWL